MNKYTFFNYSIFFALVVLTCAVSSLSQSNQESVEDTTKQYRIKNDSLSVLDETNKADSDTPISFYVVISTIGFFLGLGSAAPYIGKICTLLFNLLVLVLIGNAVLVAINTGLGIAFQSLLLLLALIFGGGIGFYIIKQLGSE